MEVHGSTVEVRGSIARMQADADKYQHIKQLAKDRQQRFRDKGGKTHDKAAMVQREKDRAKARWLTGAPQRQAKAAAKAEKRMQRRAKAAAKTCKNQGQGDEKSRKNRPKTEENPRKTGFGRLWALRVGLGRVKVAQKRARDGLRTASWAVLDAKLAVLAAMLAVLDAKLPAQEHPNDVRSRPWPLFEQESKIERRLYRFFVVFVLSRKTSDVHSVPVFTVFCCS